MIKLHLILDLSKTNVSGRRKKHELVRISARLHVDSAIRVK